MKYPTDLVIYLDTKCNLNCFFCLYHNDPRKPVTEFSLVNLIKLKKAIQHAKVISFSAWGDPLCSPFFPEAVRYCCEVNHGKHLIAFVTNGILLSPQIADLLQRRIAAVDISLNAATPATYNSDMRGGDFNHTLSSIQSFMSATDSPERVGLHFVAHAMNYAEIPAFVSLAHSLNIRRVRVDQLMVPSTEQAGYSLLNVKHEYSNAISEASQVAHKLGINFKARSFDENKGEKCSAPYTECHIWVDGRVAPCCYSGSTFMGNAYETSFEEVWSGKRYDSMRQGRILQCFTCPWVLPLNDPLAHIYPMLQENRYSYPVFRRERCS